MDYHNIQISLFENHYSVRPKTSLSIVTFMECSKWEYKTEVEALRRITVKKERDYKKKLLPCITTSGLFASNKTEGLIKHSGIVAIDIDAKDNPNINDWKE